MEERPNKPQIIIENIFENVDLERELLRTTPYELVVISCSQEALLASLTANTVAIINVLILINENLVAQMPSSLKIIMKLGAGYDKIDVKACRNRHIEVCNVPDYGTTTVADHAVALVFAAQRRLFTLHRAIVEHRHWNYKCAGLLRNLDTMTLGIIGGGRIGRCFAEKMRPFVKNILMFPSKQTPANILEQIFEECDIISLHIPYNSDNHHFISSTSLSQMKRRPMLINVSRGGLIDTPALIEALKTGQISYAALDVVEGEPMINEELIQLENVLLTPHAAWYSIESEETLRKSAIVETLRVLIGEKPLNPIFL